jgi:RNase P subunit RPR2
MRWSQDVASKIIAKLNQVLPNMKCPLCHTDDWIVASGYVFLSAYEHPSSMMRELYRKGGELPCVAITCKVCGNTHLMNLLQLGLGDLLKD